ncbi:hypothetical protein KR074_008443, partial [Drosophila pseudoananassae]
EDKIINGSAIITHSNCTVEINKIIYDNTEEVMTEHLNMLLPPIMNITTNHTAQIITLQNLHLKSINLLKQMSQVEISQSYHTTALYSSLGVILTLTIILWIQRRRKIIMFPYHMDQPLDVTKPIPSLWPSLRSGGGGVTDYPSVTHLGTGHPPVNHSSYQ